MSILTQKTLSKSITFKGIGIHTGSGVNLKINPASPNTGIIFKRVDLSSNNIIYANYSNVSDTTLCTTISNEHGVKVSTIEHLMGALYGTGVDNAIIELDSQEVPIMDGSAKVFVDHINKVGLKFSDSPIKIIKINSNQAISLQYHKFREEHWVILKGRGTVQIDKKERRIKKGDYINIKRNEIHRIHNIGKQILSLIEVQLGTSTSEKDIVRIEDLYGRK